MLFWNIILTMVVVPFGWAFNKMFQEGQTSADTFLKQDREEYATKEDVRQDIGRVMEALHRLEDKLDRVLSIK